MARVNIGITPFADWPRTNQYGHMTIFPTAEARTAAGFTGTRQKLNANNDPTIFPAWDDDVETGWYIFNGAFSKLPPRTPLQELKDETNATLDQMDAWDNLLDTLSHGYDASLVQTGHDYLWRARGAMYLVLSNSTYTVPQKLAFVKAVRLGALDITSVSAFYTSFEGDPGPTVSSWCIWVNPSDADRINLINSMVITGTIPDTVALYARQWVEALT